MTSGVTIRPGILPAFSPDPLGLPSPLELEAKLGRRQGEGPRSLFRACLAGFLRPGDRQPSGGDQASSTRAIPGARSTGKSDEGLLAARREGRTGYPRSTPACASWWPKADAQPGADGRRSFDQGFHPDWREGERHFMEL